LFMVFII